jgi:hypothetical protein
MAIFLSKFFKNKLKKHEHINGKKNLTARLLHYIQMYV